MQELEMSDSTHTNMLRNGTCSDLESFFFFRTGATENKFCTCVIMLLFKFIDTAEPPKTDKSVRLIEVSI